ncbi:MAG: exosortase/archaeosortase family protein [Planctomycetota bacterium]|nr:exosortase/archaeosortase family protein [Planctomycetota bacterium]
MTTLSANPGDATSGQARSINPAPARDERGVGKALWIVIAIFCAGGFLSLFFRWFLVQHEHSRSSPEDWGHAYAVPLISAFLAWRQRAKLASIPTEVFWPALAPFLLGIGAYFVCVVGIKNHMLQGFSMILTLYALLLLMLGPRMMRWLFIPIAYLGFGVTIAEIIMIKITFPLQLIASQGAWIMLKIVALFAGFEVDVAGTTLTVITSNGTVHPLNVAEQCSGMRMVIAFFALAAAVAFISCRQWWQRVALLLLAAPVAVFMNVIRVAVLGLATLVDPGFSQGDAHMLIGTLLLVPGLGLFMLCVWALNKSVNEDEASLAAAGASNLGGSKGA